MQKPSAWGKQLYHPAVTDVCKFTISQKLRVEVPVIFGARAEVGKASVDCDYAVNCGCSDMGM